MHFIFKAFPALPFVGHSASGKDDEMNTQMNLQRISIDKLKPAKYNPRKDLKPCDPAYEKIKRSLHDFGYRQLAEQYEGLENRLKGMEAESERRKMQRSAMARFLKRLKHTTAPVGDFTLNSGTQ